VGGSDLPLDRLSHRTRLEAGLAFLLPTAAAAAWLWINAPYFAGLYLICAMLVAVPLLAVTRRAFVILCLIIAALFVPISILGVFLGLFLFFPSAVVVVAAAGLAARRPRARTAARIAAWLVASSVLAGFGLAFRHHVFAASDIIIVNESAPVDRNSARLNSLSDSIYKAGFTSVSVSTWTSDRQLAVDAPGLPERQRQRLLTFVRARPGVVTACWCEGTQCNG